MGFSRQILDTQMRVTKKKTSNCTLARTSQSIELSKNRIALHDPIQEVCKDVKGLVITDVIL